MENSLINTEQRKGIYDYLVTCAKIGYPKRRNDVIVIVRKTLEHKARNIEFKGDGWYNRFMEWWPPVPSQGGQARANVVTSANLAEYFSVLEETLQEHNLMNCPN